MIHTKEKYYTIYNDSCLTVMDNMEENSIDAIITDPPYHLQSIVKRFGKSNSAEATTKNNDGSFARLSKGFMGKEWDGGDIAFRVDTWKKALRVLKPGGYLLAFNHSRTFHRMAVAIEDAGFEIRDAIMWLYGSGFPKSYDVSKGIDKMLGYEREVVGVNPNAIGRKENKGKFQPKLDDDDNLNERPNEITAPSSPQAKQWNGYGSALKPAYEPIIMARKPIEKTIASNVLKWRVGAINIDDCGVGSEEGNTVKGRFPANVIHDGSDEAVSDFSKYKGSMMHTSNLKDKADRKPSDYIFPEDEGSASRFFYTAKASKKDRDEGLDIDYSTNAFQRGETLRKNIHPTVKPTELMQYLVRLVSPPNSVILDPFMGSGSTGKAVMIENNERNSNYQFIGIDLEKEYCDIAKTRIEYGINYKENKAKEEEKDIVADGQTSIFDY